jgi:hypothetical protein
MNKTVTLFCATTLPFTLGAWASSDAVDRTGRAQFVTEFYALYHCALVCAQLTRRWQV